MLDKLDRIEALTVRKRTDMKIVRGNIERAILRLPFLFIAHRNNRLSIRPPPYIAKRVPPEQVTFILHEHDQFPRRDLFAMVVQFFLTPRVSL